ncbi:uncharacterized protein LOC114967028 [Acropora millepora]|uniref:uncharacterized protein LOC114967028 n=1 Tax=Acropora millepora TaxID=45264 RepID=UPI001CF46B77|nr:uncharacterized protein LOC114967028 [Acropora millepora]
MFVYSSFSLLAIRNSMKPLTCHGLVRRPSLPSHVWNMLKSFDLLVPRRGQRGREYHRLNRINTIISSERRPLHRIIRPSKSFLLNIQDRHISTQGNTFVNLQNSSSMLSDLSSVSSDFSTSSPSQLPFPRTLINVPIAISEDSAISTNSLKFCNLNTRSIKNKSADFVCYVKSCAADIFAITETWFTDMDCAHRAEATPPGYKLYDHPRSGRMVCGTALMCREGLTVTKVAAGEQRSFEFSEWVILGQGSRKIRIVIVYRLQYSPNHPVSTGVFFEEFSDYLESLILSSEPLLITGDFNIHVNVAGDPNRLKLLELLETMGLRQHVTTSTHESGNTLDLIITRQFEDLVRETPISDYHIFRSLV